VLLARPSPKKLCTAGPSVIHPAAMGGPISARVSFCFALCFRCSTGKLAYLIEGILMGDLGGGDSDWVARLTVPQNSNCGALHGGSLNATEWTMSGLFEQASAASFARFFMILVIRLSLQLLAVAAPEALVRESFDSALDELEHAKLCFGIASSLAG